jgi:putative cell wall-binding protein
MKLLCFDPHKNKRVLCGEVIGEALFRWVKPEHFMRVVQGYGIQEVAFQEVVRKGIKTIILKETNTNQRWEASIKIWLENSKIMDFGYGKQRFLSLKFMKTHLLKERDIKKEKIRDIRKLEIQRSLF